MRGGSTVCHTGDVGHRFAMTFLGVRGKRVVGDADPYEVGKNPVGRDPCAPPLGAQSMSGGGTHGCRPTGTLLRSLKGRGEGTPPYGSNCVENAQTRRRSGVFGCMYSFSGQHSGSWGITMAAMI